MALAYQWLPNRQAKLTKITSRQRGRDATFYLNTAPPLYELAYNLGH